MSKIALLGASGHGKVVAEAALATGWTEVVFFDDRWPAVTENGRWAVVGDFSSLLDSLSSYDSVVVAIGNCAIRVAKQQVLERAGAVLATIVHPRATVSDYARLGTGTVVMAGAVISVDSVVGKCSIVNTGATVDHDCVLDVGVHISPGAHLAGNVTVGACSWVGIGAVVRQGLHIGAGVMVGAGSVVVKPVGDGMTVVGNPAAPIKASGERAVHKNI